jgi:hypothetical protein
MLQVIFLVFPETRICRFFGAAMPSSTSAIETQQADVLFLGLALNSSL